METEKIKTIQVTPEILEAIQNSEVLEINDKRYIEFNKVCYIVEKAVAHFKQPPVSVMPSEEEIEKRQVKNIAELVMSCGGDTRHETMDWLHKHFVVLRRKELLSLSKEAPKERIPDVGETIKETAIEFAEWLLKNECSPDFSPGNVPIWFGSDGLSGTTEQLFDLFKQRNK